MPNHTTLTYLTSLRATLRKELSSEDHYEKTETTTYGQHDPFKVKVVNCDICNNVPKYSIINRKYVYTCVLCKTGEKDLQQTEWKAALFWNSKNLNSISYKDIPLFGLSSLTAKQAHKRLVSIRENIELRKKLASVERRISIENNTRQPGRKYRRRLEAYLKWSVYAIRLAKKSLEE